MILIPSCAAYSDCWLPWLSFYQRHWPNGNQQLVLATDVAVPRRSRGFDRVLVLSKLVGKDYPTAAWTTRLCDALPFIDDESFILCCEDHWPLPSADWHTVRLAQHVITKKKADCVRLAPCPSAPESLIPPFGPVGDIPYRISCGPTLWNTQRLYSFLLYLKHVLPLPTAHHYENFGSPASTRFGLNVWATCENASQLPFLNSAVTGGKWNPSAINLANSLGIRVDTSNRPLAD